ncbi:MAG: transglutaminase family protein [Anaerolineae bacterium]|nr:transglutaminase family protein [Anaerolineae bacterium]MCA9889548.1 transglutaminase family protein [Anaerolineae bacterium]MCA9895241.1 transglutaminase family protein [Anaerolineae bacterium]MCB9460606.1 transglutaminase family protein [Anaerolineaceae bacterium]
MFYAITHLTDYHYSGPITDSVMELRIHPRSEIGQRCIRFDLEVSPDARILNHRDYLGNTVHTFDIPAPHTELAIKAESFVEVKTPPPLPDALPYEAWDQLDKAIEEREIYDMLLPGQYTKVTPLLKQFAQEIGWGERYADPLTLLRDLNNAIYEHFDYVQDFTKADSPIDIALDARKGVCQDFTHIMLALLRQVGIPARYVSGYLYHRKGANDRSFQDASHAWIEAYVPGFMWVGFDPTNNLIVTDRHIRVCVAQDYAKASPTRGVFKGNVETKLKVRVQVTQKDDVPEDDEPLAPEIVMPHYSYQHQQQQQQQQ